MKTTAKCSKAAHVLTHDQQKKLTEILEAKRDELRLRRAAGVDDRLLEVESDPIDEATDKRSEAEDVGVAKNDVHILREIDAALLRIENGTYGVSEESGTPIAYERLVALPWARS